MSAANGPVFIVCGSSVGDSGTWGTIATDGSVCCRRGLLYRVPATMSLNLVVLIVSGMVIGRVLPYAWYKTSFWQLESGPRVSTDVCEGPLTTSIQLLQFVPHPTQILSRVFRCCIDTGNDSLHNSTCSFQSTCIRTNKSQKMHPDCHNLFNQATVRLQLLPEFFQSDLILLQQVMFECVVALHLPVGGLLPTGGRKSNSKARTEC